MKVPLFDARREYEALAPELLAAAERALASGRYILGPEVEAFEREMTAYLGARHAIGVASGTDALFLALRAAGVRANDRVLTTPFTFFATASAIANLGAEPVFADVDPGTLNLSPEAVRRVLEGDSEPHQRLGVHPDTIKAVVPVHLFGQPAHMQPVMRIAREYGLWVIEDAAQALGSEYQGRKVGTIGDAGCLSFFPTKNLGGFGDGGMIVTRDAGLAERARLLRAHGSSEKYRHRVVGTNSRLDALQAALLRVKLTLLEGFIETRRVLAERYDDALGEMDSVRVPQTAAGRTHTYHQYVIRIGSRRRDDLRDALSELGVETAVHYPQPLHMQEALKGLGYLEGDFPAAEAASGEVVSLPMSPHLTSEEQSFVVQALKTSLRR